MVQIGEPPWIPEKTKKDMSDFGCPLINNMLVYSFQEKISTQLALTGVIR